VTATGGAAEAMARTTIGSLQVGVQGLGCLGMSEFYGATDETEAVATVRAALAAGVTLLDTADVSGHGGNEELIGRAVAGRRDAAVLATKFGVVRPGPGVGSGVRGDAAYVREAAEASLRRLGTDRIDLFYLTRVDPDTPIEETVGALAELVRAGKVREIGLSEPGPETIRRANAVHPVAAVQTEWSLWSRDIEDEVAPLCRELDIAVVPYAPLGRGFLAGAVRSRDDLDEGDFRSFGLPRFSAENLPRNLALADRLAAAARRRGVSAAALALAWLHHRDGRVVPSRGTRRRSHLSANAAAAGLALSAAELAELDGIFPPGVAAGQRWNEASMAYIGR
jgi:aryl-alcohol dehydrogenase-like predicted oxidoreductase